MRTGRPRTFTDDTLVGFVRQQNNQGLEPSTRAIAEGLGLNYYTVRERLIECPEVETINCPCGQGVLWVATH